MPIPIPKKLVEFALLGPTHDRRQLQDSPILGDVWLAFADAPGEACELLIEPHWQESAGTVAAELNAAIERKSDQDGPDVAALHGIVAARLFFEELLKVVVPRTTWWNKGVTHDRFVFLRGDTHATKKQSGRSNQPADPLARVTGAAMEIVARWLDPVSTSSGNVVADDGTLPALDRFLAIVTLIRWAGAQEVTTAPVTGKARKPVSQREANAQQQESLRARLAEISPSAMRRLIVDALRTFPAPVPTSASAKSSKASHVQKPRQRIDIIWQVSLNRTATAALVLSVPAVKGDAARRLFAVSCKQITWAVIDSGIQGDHPAFFDADGISRVKRSFDFTNIREIVSLDNLKKNRSSQRLAKLLNDDLKLRERPNEADAIDSLTRLSKDASERRPIDWELVRRFVEIEPSARPRASDHGTHVAGIIGASKEKDPSAGSDSTDLGDGMCPDIQLWDFRVLAPGLKETEFAIIAALQFIQYMNSRTDYMSIHGANLSLSIPHDVRNYACGRTPICLECERLVDSGVVVVAAAGNLGYQSFQTSEGSYDGYAAFSVTDPGNADGVLTVGSTHRSEPHTYGVSFFSSRGPTGDGRAKPDLVAPGERIRAPFREGWGDLDGTSMAAPHASGAAAMLMARYSELIAQPRRVKKILCESATDLGRERSFQGSGMLDVLRAFQSI